MLRRITMASIMALILSIGGLQLIAPEVEAKNPECLACCPSTMGGKWLYDCSGPHAYSPLWGHAYGCGYTDGTTYDPFILVACH